MTPAMHLQAGTVLVTGAGGFVGGHVVAALKSAGVIVRSLLGPPQNIGGMPLSRMSQEVEADICDSDILLELVTGADCVIHLAGPPSVAASFEDAAEYARIHVQGTISVLDACRRARVHRMVYLSSAEVYGRSEAQFITEDHSLQARSPYAAAKIGAEAMITAYATGFALNAVILRPFSIYGPGAPATSLISEVTQKLLVSENPVVRDLNPVRDYCFIDDVTLAIVKAYLYQEAGVLICNIGTMRGSSVAEICQLLIRVLGRKTAILQDDRVRRPGSSDIFRLVSDNRRAHSLLGWSPAVTLEEGLARTVEALSR